MTGPAKLAPAALLAITLLLGACDSAAPQPIPTLLARGTFVIRDWDKVEFEATREGTGVSGRMTVGQNEGAPDFLRVDLRCAGTTEDGLLMIGGHTVGAGGRFAGMPVGTFAAIALRRAPVKAAIWGYGSGPWTPTTDCVANLDAWLTEERTNHPTDEIWLREFNEGTVEFGP